MQIKHLSLSYKACSQLSTRLSSADRDNRGFGGRLRALAAGADRVIGVDRDPLALEMAAAWIGDYGDRLTLVPGTFSELDQHAGGPLDGVVLDLGISSMQIDRAERGFSFQKDGPLDMRMSQDGPSAADLVNTSDETVLADVLYHYGEERASRRIAHAIVAARAVEPITTTLRLAEIVARCLPRPKPGQSHPATRSFQAIRIAVNTEFEELAEGLAAAERALKPGGQLAVVSFHSLEDRIVKRFIEAHAHPERQLQQTDQRLRRLPLAQAQLPQPRLRALPKVLPDAAEVAANPRARSAVLRVAERTGLQRGLP